MSQAHKAAWHFHLIALEICLEIWSHVVKAGLEFLILSLSLKC